MNRLEQGVSERRRQLWAPSDFIGPIECRIDPDNTARAIMTILGSNYGVHNVSSDVTALAEEIGAGRIQPFLRFDEKNVPFACAALIKTGELDVELGRVASIPGSKRGNGELMIRAFEAWSNGSIFPESKTIRAEVRTAKPTKEVPGGQATQVICFKKLGFRPTAMAPMFHHGVPDRQEVFILASKTRNESEMLTGMDGNMPIPRAIGNDNEQQMFSIFWQKFFEINPNFVDKALSEETIINFESKQQGPILIVRPLLSASETSETTNQKIDEFFSRGGRFVLARLPTGLPFAQIESIAIKLKRIGFTLLGFEPVITGRETTIEILMGKLSDVGKERLVLPSLVEDVFDHDEEDILIRTVLNWRKR